VVPDYDLASIVGIFVKTGTSPEIVRRISEMAIAATKDPEVIEQLSVAGVEAAGAGPDEFSRALSAERGRIEKAVSAAGIVPQ
jgi:tripartite-type tricarboxylate transporter receptor subunit TctC